MVQLWHKQKQGSKRHETRQQNDDNLVLTQSDEAIYPASHKKRLRDQATRQDRDQRQHLSHTIVNEALSRITDANIRDKRSKSIQQLVDVIAQNL